jgi:hypothetical protein
VLYFGGLSAKSFSRFEIVKEVLDEWWGSSRYCDCCLYCGSVCSGNN